MKKHLLTCIFAAPLLLFGQQTYIWSVSSGSWTDPVSWTPQRTTPAVNDILEFSTNATVTNMPAAESIGKLWLHNNAVVNLSTTIASVITIGHATVTAPHFAIDAGAALQLSGNNPLEFHIAAGSSGAVSGSIDFFDEAHRLKAASTNALKFKSGAVFTANTGFKGNAFGTTSLNSVVFENGATYTQKTGGNPFGAIAPDAVSVFNSGSIYVFQRDNIPPSVAGRTYGNLYIDAKINFGGIGSARDCIIQNDFKLVSGHFYYHPESGSHTGNFNIYGNIICEDTSYINIGSDNMSGAVQLMGTHQTIGSGGGSGSITIKNLTVNNNNSTLTRDLTITGTLDLKQGIVHSSAAAKLILGTGAGIQSCAHDYSYLTESNLGCDNAYVEGPVQKQGLNNADFAFPVGAAGKLRPIFLRNATGNFTVEYNARDPYIEIGSAMGAGIHHISHIEYWNVSGSGSSSVELSFFDPNSGGITDMNALRVARYTGSVWEDRAVSVYRGTPGSNGSVTSSTMSEFGNFSLASSSNYPNNPLPTWLTRFTATPKTGQILLSWTVSQEAQSIEYIVEKSADGTQFAPMPGRLSAAGNFPHEYQLIDKEPFNGKNHYRLQLIRQNGSHQYSEIITVYLPAFYPIRVYPNPSREKIFIKIPDSSSISTLAVVHINGSVVRLINTGTLTTVSVDISNLSPGLYYIKNIRGQSSLVVPFIKYNQ